MHIESIIALCHKHMACTSSQQRTMIIDWTIAAVFGIALGAVVFFFL